MVKNLYHGCLLDPNNAGVFKGGRRRHASRLAGEAAFTEKAGSLQNSGDGFFALLGNNRELAPTVLDVKDGISRISLRKGGVLVSGAQKRFPLSSVVRKV
jgi:hypothetical protein